ncbi:MAG: hypothetical protein K6E86_07365 [Bacteroidales bacterium]|nr:hypothetical protein [Bacteroidales bacterium]
MKKIYSMFAVALASVSMAMGQKVVTEPLDIVYPWQLSDEFNKGGINFIGCTATIKYFALNIAGLPKAFSRDANWHPVILTNGAAVKFKDEPNYIYPTAENFEETDNLDDEIDFSWDACAQYSVSSQVIENDWVIEGEGNAIYLDSYCHFGGTITGKGDLTIYVTNKSQLDFACGNVNNTVDSAFVGTIYIKSLDGYTCDTINVGTNFKVGQLHVGPMATKTYAGSCSKFDITSFDGAVVWNQVGANSLIYPPIVGKGVIQTSNYPYFPGFTNAEGNEELHVYDAEIHLGGSDSHDFEVYGNSQAFNQPIKGVQKHFYVRSGAQIYFNSAEPSMSEFVDAFSQRGTGITGGTGYADISYYPNGGRVNTLSPGYPYTEVGQMTWRYIQMYSGNVVRFDFDNEGHADVINVADKYVMYSGQNEVSLGLPDNFQPKAGKYKVINGTVDAGMATYVDTVGYEVWDNNGPAYVIRSVKGGEVIALADGSNDAYVAQPGDSIGKANFGQLEGTYGATIMDGNRPHYTILEWGPGSYSNNEPTDGEYKNTESPTLYTANENQIGTAFSDPDSTKWSAVWQQFVDEHPVSDAWEAVTVDDPSVIPGTVTDSIFLTYSHYRSNDVDGGVAGDHAWSYKNGSGSLCADKGYPYASPITYAYYYYFNNSVRVQTGRSSVYTNGADTTATVTFAQQTYPIALTQNSDSVMKVTVSTVDTIPNDTTWTFKTDTIAMRWYTAWSTKVAQGTEGDSVQYRFNFKNFITDGIIAIETQVTKADGVVEQNLPAEEDSEEIVNEGDLTGIGTMLKETHAVKERDIFNVAGLRVNSADKGLHIVRTVYSDGTIETKRVMMR